MMEKKLILMVDVVSPFAYLAFHVLRTSSVFKNVQISFVPVLLGGIIKATGNTPPINIKNKGSYMAREKLRWAKLFDIPIAEQFPPGFPLNTLQAQRALVAASLVRPDLWEEALAALFHAAWVDRKPVGSFEQVQPIFNLLFGDKATQEIIKKASEPLVLPLVTDKAPQATSQEVKDLLTKQTNHALQSGSFGLPWFIATNALGETECFWGFDHLGQVTDFLDLQRVTAVGEKESGWRAML